MEMTMTKEANVNSPISGASILSSTSTGVSGSAVQQSFQERGAFSETLSVALDKPALSESVENKKLEKTKPDDGEGTQPEKALQGLPLGLIWSPPVPELLVSALNTVKQKGAPNTDTVDAVGIQNSLQQYTGGVIEAGSILAPQATTQGTLEKQELIGNTGTNQLTSRIQPTETVVTGLVEKMTSAEANDVGRLMVSTVPANSVPAGSNPAVPANLFVAGQIVAKGTAQPVEEKQAESTPNLQFSVIKPNEPQKIVPVQVMVDAGTVKSPEVSTMTAPVEEKQAEATPNLQYSLTKTNEPRKIVPVQVIVDAGTVKSPAASTVTGPVEEKQAESISISSNGVTTTEFEQQANEDTDNGSLKGSLSQSQNDHLNKTLTTIDNDSNLAVAASFNQTFNSVDQASVSSEVAAQPRQELHDVAIQIMDGMTASTDRLKSSQIIVTLKPEHLGEVTVKINVDGDKVTAAFHAASSEVRAILESSLPQLKQEMSQQGWNFDSSGVFDGMQGFLANHQQRQPQDQTQHIPQSHRVKPDKFDGIMAFTSNGSPQLMSAAAVDYRI